MNLSIVEQITKSQLRTDLPDFKPGYQVRVDVRIQEGDKFRIQAFEGLVIARQGKVSVKHLSFVKCLHKSV